MSDDTEETKIITGRFTAKPIPLLASDDHPIVALIKEGVAMAEGDGAKPTQIVYVMLDDECCGTVGYLTSAESGSAHPRALMSLAMTMINGLIVSE